MFIDGIPVSMFSATLLMPYSIVLGRFVSVSQLTAIVRLASGLAQDNLTPRGAASACEPANPTSAMAVNVDTNASFTTPVSYHFRPRPEKRADFVSGSVVEAGLEPNDVRPPQ